MLSNLEICGVMMSKKRYISIWKILFAVTPIGLFGCATSNPVVYQNKASATVSEEVLRRDIAGCETEARDAGLKPNGGPGSDVARDTVKGGALGGATGAVSGAIGGNAGRGAQYGAAAGATACNNQYFVTSGRIGRIDELAGRLVQSARRSPPCAGGRGAKVRPASHPRPRAC